VVSRSEGEQESRKRDRAKQRRHERGETTRTDWLIRAPEWCQPRPIAIADLLRGPVPFIDQAGRRRPSRRASVARGSGDPCRDPLSLLSSLPPFLLCERRMQTPWRTRSDRPIIHAPPGTWKAARHSRRKRRIVFSKDD